MALKRTLGPWQYFSFSFGTVVGVGWIVLLGDWLQRGGPAGAIIGFAVGGLLMALIGLCYAEASGMFPVSGGEMAFALEGFGKRAGFGTGWALVLVFIAAAAIAAAPLPAARQITRPFGTGRRCEASTTSGWAAATAASKIERSRGRRSVIASLPSAKVSCRPARRRYPRVIDTRLENVRKKKPPAAGRRGSWMQDRRYRRAAA